MAFSSIPILDLSLARDPSTKPQFLSDLRDALLRVGFLYISNTGIPDSVVRDVIANGKAFFDLPDEAKLEIQMKNAKSFLGYSKLGNEITAHRTDWREQIDLSTPHPVPPPSAPAYHNLRAPNQWPSVTLLPAFRPAFARYMELMAEVSGRFTALVAEALSLPASAFDAFFDADQQHKLKVVRYPDLDELGAGVGGEGEGEEGAGNGGGGTAAAAAAAAQGVGPHKDSMLTSYLLQASPHAGLQARNLAGEWIECPPREGTLVVAIGQAMEAVTGGVCASTTHRVLSPGRGRGARYSVPFFQGVSFACEFATVEVPPAVVRQKARLLPEGGGGGEGGRSSGAVDDEVEFGFVRERWACFGEAMLWNRCKSHMDVAERWYPDIWRRIRDGEVGGSAGGGGGGEGEVVIV